MISKITGKIINIDNTEKFITVLSMNIGFAIYVSDEKVYSLDQEVSLDIYFYWNQENGPQLFGFSSILSRQVFSLIISCSGIGPKIGLAALSQMAPEDLINYIILGDIKALSKINGIGTKKAELIITYLKDKASKLFNNLPKTGNNNLVGKITSISDVLTSLNYSNFEIKSTLDYIRQNFSGLEYENLTLDDLLRKSLAFIVKLNNKI